MSNYDEENINDSTKNDKDLFETTSDISTELDKEKLEDFDKTNEMPFIDLSLNSSIDNDNIKDNTNEKTTPTEIVEPKVDFSEDGKAINYSSENYYDFTLNNIPKVKLDDNNLTGYVDLSKQKQDNTAYNQNNYYNNRYQNNQNLNYNNNPYNNGFNQNQAMNQNPYLNQYNQNMNRYNYNMNYNNNMNNMHYQSSNISKAPFTLGIIAGILPIISLLGLIVIMGALNYDNMTLSPRDLMQDTYIREKIFSIILVWVVTAIVGVAIIVFAIISTRYIKVATIGFLVCTILFLMLTFPGYGGAFFPFILGLIATIVNFGNMKKIRQN